MKDRKTKLIKNKTEKFNAFLWRPTQEWETYECAVRVIVCEQWTPQWNTLHTITYKKVNDEKKYHTQVAQIPAEL